MQLNLPHTYAFQTQIGDKGVQVWDPVRKKWVYLTPEEFVRQHFIRFLHQTYGHPFSRMRVEKGVQSLKQIRRTDIEVYNDVGELHMLIECKRSDIELNQQHWLQTVQYASSQKPLFIGLSNGVLHFFLKRQSDGSYVPVPSLE